MAATMSYVRSNLVKLGSRIVTRETHHRKTSAPKNVRVSRPRGLPGSRSVAALESPDDHSPSFHARSPNRSRCD